MKASTNLLSFLMMLFFLLGENYILAQPTPLNQSENYQFLSNIKTTYNDSRINDDDGTEYQLDPAIAINKYGYTVVCWYDRRNGNTDIYAQLFGPAGFRFKKNFKVNDDLGSRTQMYPDVAMDNRGRFVIVWLDHRSGSTNPDIYAQRFEANGDPIGNNFKVNDDPTGQGHFNVSVAMDGAGNFVVCWRDYRNGSSWDVYAQRFDNTGTPIGPNIKVNQVDTESQLYPSIDMNESGAFVIAWSDKRDGSDHEVYAQRFDRNGSRQGGNFIVSNHPGSGYTKWTAVAIHENETFMVCWSFISSYPTANIYGRVYNNYGNPVTGQFKVNNIACPDPTLSAFPNPLGGYSVAWHTDRNGDYDIYARNFNDAGAPTSAPNRANDAPGEQKNPDIAGDPRGIGVFVWDDDRNGNKDIYATAFGPLIPLNVTAGTGFDGLVPLTWDPVYAQDGVTMYNVYRSTTPGGPYALLTSVDLSARGPLGASMRDWVDTDVFNGTTYYYAVTAVIPGWESNHSVKVSATPSAEGYSIQSARASNSPTIDGQLSSGEWDDATAIDIAAPSAALPITLYVKNDENQLYLAVDDPNDASVNAGNLLGILFDENYDKAWGASAPSGEGAIRIYPTATSFIGYWGEYPNNLNLVAPVAPSGVSAKIAATSGNVQYEAAFDLTTSPLNTAPGQTIGACIWIDDPGNFYPYHYGNAGEWPAGALWDAASPLGNLILAGDEQESVTYDFPQQGWYLISLPLIPDDNRLSALFPTALGAYGYDTNTGAYYTATSLEPRKGYWLLIPSATSETISGVPLTTFTEHYPSGWHLIGSVNSTTNFTDPDDNPNGSVIGAYGWNVNTSQYFPVYPSGTGQLEARRGYWLAVIQACDLTIGGAGAASAEIIAKGNIQSFQNQFGSQPPDPPFLEDRNIAQRLPITEMISRNFPNPFNPETVIEYSLPNAGLTQIHIYNALGQRIRTLLEREQTPGIYRIVWNGRNDEGNLVTNGIYFYRIINSGKMEANKMLLMK